HNDRRFLYRDTNFMRDSHLVRKRAASEVLVVLVRTLDFSGKLRVVHPQRNSVRVTASRQCQCQRRAPTSASENGDALHSRPLLLPNENRGSRPSTSRSMFASCS